jgi:ABC-type amino acid transport substrate-binding protein
MMKSIRSGIGRWAAMLVALGVLALGSGKADTLSDARQNGTLHVGVGLMGTKPFNWQEADGGYHGVEADLTKELVKRLGISKYEFVVTEWSTLIPGLQSKRWDVIISGMATTEERIQGAGVLFSDPYLLGYDQIIVKKGSPIKSIDDLKGKSLGSLVGGSDSLVAHSLADKGLAAEVKDFGDFTAPFIALRNGQVDAVIMDQLTFGGMKESMPNLVAVGDPLFYIPKPEWQEAQNKAKYVLGSVGVAMRKDDAALRDAINKALVDMEADGTRKQIFEKYGVWDESQARNKMLK